MLLGAPTRLRPLEASQQVATEAQLVDAARAHGQSSFKDFGQGQNWIWSRQPDGGISAVSPDGNRGVKVIFEPGRGIVPQTFVRVFRPGGKNLVDRTERQPNGTLLTLSLEGSGGRVIPTGELIDPAAVAAATASVPPASVPTTPAPSPPPTSATPSGTTADASPTPPTLTIRLVPEAGAPGSVVLGQNFRVEVDVPASQAPPKTLTVRLATTDGSDDEPVVVTAIGTANGLVSYQSALTSIGGNYGDWRVSVLPFGFGNVSVGGFTTPGTLMGLDLGNGESVTATVTLPTGAAGTSMQVFDTPTDQALVRAYEAMFAMQETLRIDTQLLGQAQSSGTFTADQLVVINGMLANNAVLSGLLRDANQWVATETRPYAQLVILTNYLNTVSNMYENGLTQDPRDLRDSLNGGIRRDIEGWQTGVADQYLTGVGMAFYNGVTAIPFTNAGYTLSTSLFTSFQTGTFNTGQTVWGTQATTGQWVWAWVEVAGNVSLMRMYGGPRAVGGSLSPFRDPRARVTPLPPGSLQMLDPIERAVWNQAARIAQRIADDAARAGREVDIVAVHQNTIKQLGALADKVGLPHATRAYNAMHDAWKAGHAIDEAAILSGTAAPRALPPLGGTPPPAPPPAVVPPVAAPPAVAVPGAAGRVARELPVTTGVTGVPATGPAIPGGVIFIDPLILQRARMWNPKGLAGVPDHLLSDNVAHQALLRQAILNPGRVRIPEWNVNVGKSGDFVNRRLTKDEWAFFCGNGAARTGPGTTQAGASLPLLGALGNCLANGEATSPTASASPSVPTVNSADLDASAERVAWYGCSYIDHGTRPGPADCQSWSQPTLVNPTRDTTSAAPTTGVYVAPTMSPDTALIEFAVPTNATTNRPVVPAPPSAPLTNFTYSSNPGFVMNASPFATVQILAATSEGVVLFIPAALLEPVKDEASALAGSWRGTTRFARNALAALGVRLPASSALAIAAPGHLATAVGSEAPRDTVRAEQPPSSPLTVLVTSTGRSAGDAFEMTVLNRSATPVQLSATSLVLEPVANISRDAIAKTIASAAGAGRATTTLKGYCLEFLKLPPTAGMAFRIASDAVQRRFASTEHIFAASRALREAGALTPGPGEAGADEYFDATRQWAIWTLEQKFDERGYQRAFLSHARKNVESGGRRWTSAIEKAVGGLLPARWAAIQHVLREAGATVAR